MTSVPLIGQQLGKYHIRGLLGEGAMAWVFLAYELPSEGGIHGEVALKVLKPQFSSDTEVVGRFQDEARSAAQLRHGNIVVIWDFGKIDGWNYIAMEYVRGRSLRQMFEAGEALSDNRIIAILRQAAMALDSAHGNRPAPGIHRDIKPENIMVGPDDTVTLVDFGLARIGTASRHTRQGEIMGTYEYMSPEQVRGELDITPATDTWSLGVVAFELLAGRTPFVAANRHGAAIMQKIANEAAPLLGHVSRSRGSAVDRVLQRALAKQPGQRWPTARAFVDALEAALSGGGPPPNGGEEKPPPPPPLEAFVAWIRSQSGTAMGIVLGVLVLSILVWLGRGTKEDPSDPTATPTVMAETATATTSVATDVVVVVTATIATDTPVPAPLPTKTAPPPTRTANPTSPPTAVRPTAVPATAVPPRPAESISFWQDGQQLNRENKCTSIKWETDGFAKVFVWAELGENDRGAVKPANGREEQCGIGKEATFNLAAVRADGSEERRSITIRREGD